MPQPGRQRPVPPWPSAPPWLIGTALVSGGDLENSAFVLLADNGVINALSENYPTVTGLSVPTVAGDRWLDRLPTGLRQAATELLESGDGDRIVPVITTELRWLRLRSRRTQAESERLGMVIRLDNLTALDPATSLIAQLIRDPLTGLYNRRAFLDLTRLPAAETARYGRVLAVDLRRFRRINEVWGRLIGDACLVETTHWLQSIGDPDDLLIRLGDAEFFVLLGPNSDADAALAGQPQRTVRIGERSLQLSLQAGVAAGTDLGDTAARAEVALSEAKRDSWRSVVSWSDAIAERTAQVATNEEAVQQAVAAGDEAVYFQTIVNVVTGRVTGVEGLVRLGGAATDLPTYEILEASHRLGLTPTFAARVYDLAFGDGLRLRELFPHCLLGINVSREFLSTGLAIDTVLASAHRCGVNPDEITLELTEDVANGLSPEMLLAELRRGAEAGLQIVIDDFGRGETSLSLLRKLPLTAIKIDRSLLPLLASDERGWDFVEGVASLLSKITGRLVVEGIETQEQSLRLRQLGLYLQQGYLFGAPKPADRWLADGFRLPTGQPVRPS